MTAYKKVCKINQKGQKQGGDGPYGPGGRSHQEEGIVSSWWSRIFNSVDRGTDDPCPRNSYGRPQVRVHLHTAVV